MKTIIPAKNYVFAEVVSMESETKSKSGILIAPSATKPSKNIAKVIETGEGSSIVFEPGRTIIYKFYAATEIKLDDKEYVIVAVEDVLGVLDES